MTLCIAESEEKEKDDGVGALNCEERFLAKTMENFPPQAAVVMRRKSTPCVCRRCHSRSASPLRRRAPGQQLFEQLLCQERKTERLLVPDLATEWFRKQKVFIDQVTPEEFCEMQRSKQLGESSTTSFERESGRRCGCQDSATLQHSVQYLTYGQEMRRRRELLLRQRQQRRRGERSCQCEDPCNWPPIPRVRPPEKKCKKRVHADHDKHKKEEEPVSTEQKLGQKITVCEPQLDGCVPKIRVAGGVVGAGKLYPHRTCAYLRPRRRSTCACTFQADGQPMGEECLAAMRRDESPVGRKRRKYNLREAPHRRLDPACFRRISPEFYSLLKSYEDGMSERYPLYGLPIRYWSKTVPCCPCEETDGCEPCLGDQSLANAPPEQPVKKPYRDCDDEDEADEDVSLESELVEGTACQLTEENSDMRSECEQDECLRNDCPERRAKLLCSEYCAANNCGRNCSEPENNQKTDAEGGEKETNGEMDVDADAETLARECCRKATCPQRSVTKARATTAVDSHETENHPRMTYKNYKPTTGALAALPEPMLMTEPMPMGVIGKQHHSKRKGWFFLCRSSRSLQLEASRSRCSSHAATDERQCKQRKGILGSVAGLCKRAIQPGRHLLYSFSTISRQPAKYAGQSMIEKRLRKKQQKQPHGMLDKDAEGGEDQQEMDLSSGSQVTSTLMKRQPNERRRRWQSIATAAVAKASMLQRHVMPPSYMVQQQSAGLGAQLSVSTSQLTVVNSASCDSQLTLVQVECSPSFRCNQTQLTDSQQTVDNAPSVDTLRPETGAASVVDAQAGKQTATDRRNLLASDYTQLMRLVARKRAKTRKYKRCTVTFMERTRNSVKQIPNVMQSQLCTRNRSISPATRKNRIENNTNTKQSQTYRIEGNYPSDRQPKMMVLTSKHETESARRDSVFHPPHAQDYERNGKAQSDGELSVSSGTSRDRSRKYHKRSPSTETNQRNSYRERPRPRPQTRSDNNRKQTCDSRRSDSAASDSADWSNDRQRQPERRVPRISHKPARETEQDGRDVPLKRRHSVDSVERQRIVTALKRDNSNATSMDTVDRNEERVANITRYVNKPTSHFGGVEETRSQQRSQQQQRPEGVSLVSYLFTKKPPVSEKLLKLRREASIKFPKLKVKGTHVKAQCSLLTRRPPPRRLFGPDQGQLMDGEQYAGIQHSYQQERYRHGQSNGRRSDQRYGNNIAGVEDDNDDDEYPSTSRGRHVTSCRSRSGCDVQFQDNSELSTASQPMIRNPSASKFFNRSANTNVSSLDVSTKTKIFNGYATPCCSACCLHDEAGKSEKPTELATSSYADQPRQTERYPRRERSVRRRPSQAIATTADATGYRSGRSSISVNDIDSGLAVALRTNAKRNCSANQLMSPLSSRSDFVPAFSESFGYPSTNRNRSRNALESPPPPPTSNKPILPCSILKSASKPLNNILKQATDIRRVNFVTQKPSDSALISCQGAKPDPVAPAPSYSCNYSVDAGQRRASFMRAHTVQTDRGQPPRRLASGQQECCPVPKARERPPSLFAVPSSVSRYAEPEESSYPDEKGIRFERLATRVKTAEELELEESRLPMNSQLISKRSDFPSTKFRRTERVSPPAVSLVSELDFNTHCVVTRQIKSEETRERGGTSTTDVPLLVTTVLDQLRKDRMARMAVTGPPPKPPGYVPDTWENAPAPEPWNPKSKRYPPSISDNYYPRRRCCLRSLPAEPLIIEATHSGLREQQMRQQCLPVLFYGRQCLGPNWN